VYDGDIFFDEWHDHIASVLDDPNWRYTTGSLSDMTGATLESMSDEDQDRIFSLFETRTLRVAGRRMAFVGTPETRPVVKDIEAQTLANLGARSAAFATLTPACIWLGVDERTITTILDELRATLGPEYRSSTT
jgi:hypothetical protein